MHKQTFLLNLIFWAWPYIKKCKIFVDSIIPIPPWGSIWLVRMVMYIFNHRQLILPLSFILVSLLCLSSDEVCWTILFNVFILAGSKNVSEPFPNAQWSIDITVICDKVLRELGLMIPFCRLIRNHYTFHTSCIMWGSCLYQLLCMVVSDTCQLMEVLAHFQCTGFTEASWKLENAIVLISGHDTGFIFHLLPILSVH